MEENKKKTPVGLIIGIVIGGVVLFVTALILLLVFVFKSGTSVFHGTWECNNNTATVTIDSKNFNMYGNSSTYVYSTYKTKEVNIDSKYSKMLIDATATKRVLNNKEYTGDYTTQYQLVIDNNNKNEMAMINSVTYSIYKCKRK